MSSGHPNGPGRYRTREHGISSSYHHPFRYEVKLPSRRATHARQIPSVGFGSHGTLILASDVGPGAFAAVGGNQTIRKRNPSSSATDYYESSQSHSSSSSRPPVRHRATYPSPSPSPSVLADFRHFDHGSVNQPGTTFGIASFSAVSGRRESVDRQIPDRSNSTHAVLPRQSQLPSPDDYDTSGYPSYATGSHSAVAGNLISEPSAANVLMNAQGFHSEGGSFEAGSFSAVGGDQVLMLPQPFEPDRPRAERGERARRYLGSGDSARYHDQRF
ncbi:hypothetical protein EV361DRAFT_937193 [Lentinula raphanica]|uniref:Uncharacterized protein n=1 Tax=Lentinula raphanica TaxID=153919 RepID=A0AA38P698_9AGAR|nr:hypothetical protein F5878DRAFT_623769 [Lentinula raphanica]KAJ3965939.1 hypothetical protein EV361DRAFT_937193 [Lentinula raphanica]